MRVYIRYDIPDEKDETRRDRNERAEIESPPLLIPEAGEYLFDLYFDISDCFTRVKDGLVSKITPSEFMAYSTLTGLEISPFEYSALRAMDNEFCKETQLEINARRQKAIEEGTKK